MKHDIPGFAYISGGEDNGKYIDAQGRLYRRQGDALVSENGSSISVSEASKGRIVGSVLAPEVPSQSQVDAMLAEAAGASTHDSSDYAGALLSSVPQPEEKPASEEAMQNEADGSTMHAPMGEPSEEYKAQAEVAARADEILATRSPSEVRELLALAKEAGADVDILDDDDEVSVRLNAETLAGVAE